MLKTRIILIALISLGISACSSSSPVVEKPPLSLPTLSPVSLDTPEWIVITSSNYQTVLEDLKSKDPNFQLIAVTTDGYKIITINNSKLLQYIIQQQKIILAYKDYYENNNKK